MHQRADLIELVCLRQRQEPHLSIVGFGIVPGSQIGVECRDLIIGYDLVNEVISATFR